MNYFILKGFIFSNLKEEIDKDKNNNNNNK